MKCQNLLQFLHHFTLKKQYYLWISFDEGMNLGSKLLSCVGLIF